MTPAPALRVTRRIHLFNTIGRGFLEIRPVLYTQGYVPVANFIIGALSEVNEGESAISGAVPFSAPFMRIFTSERVSL